MKVKVQVDYAPPQKDPSDEDRSATDRIFTYIGGLIFIAWLFFTCQALYNGRDERTSEDTDAAKLAKEILQHSAILLGPTIAVSGAIILSFLYLIYAIPEICVRVAKVFSIIAVVILSIGILLKLLISSETISSSTSEPKPGSDVQMSTLIRNLIQMGALLLSLRLVELDNVAEFIKKSFKAMFNFPSLIPFSLCMFFLQMFVVLVSFISPFQVKPEKISETWGASSLMIVLGGIYVLVCLLYFEWMVVSQTLANWHYMDSKNDSSSPSLLQSISIVFRYHLGSVAFAATLILPLCLTIYTAISHNSRKRTESSNLLVLILWYITLIFSMPGYSSILIAAYGMNSAESTKKAWGILTRKCMFSYAFVNVTMLLVGFGLMVSLYLSIFLMALSSLHVVYVAYIIYLVIVLSCIQVAPAIQITQLFSLEKDLETENNEQGPAYNMKV